MAGKRPSASGRSTSAFKLAPSRMGTSRSLSTRISWAVTAGTAWMFMRESAGLDAMQTVRSVLYCKEQNVVIRRRLAGMHDISRDVDNRAGLRLDVLAADGRLERALENVDPLLVRVRVRLCTRARGHAHQRDDHAIALDTGAIGRRVIRPSQDVVHLGELEQELARPGALGAGRSRSHRLIGHCHAFSATLRQLSRASAARSRSSRHRTAR